jgi:hypothetical protein
VSTCRRPAVSTISQREPRRFASASACSAIRRGSSLSPTAWLRLLTFKSEYGVIWRSAKRLFVKDGATSTLTTVEQRGDANPLFPQAFFAFLERGGRALMLFSEKDRSPSQYEEKFALPFADRMQRFQSQIETHVVPKANHVLSLHEWQREMVDVCRGWISGLYATR